MNPFYTFQIAYFNVLHLIKNKMVFNDSSLSPIVNKFYYAYLVIRINFLLILIHAKKFKIGERDILFYWKNLRIQVH